MNSGDYNYIWQFSEWPNWRFDLAALAGPMVEVSRAQGLLMGRLADVGMALRDQASLAALTQDVVKTSEIEGEQLNVESVRSSIARRLGVDIGALDSGGSARRRCRRDGARCHRQLPCTSVAGASVRLARRAVSYRLLRSFQDQCWQLA